MNIPFTDIELGLYNLLSCKGFETAEATGLSFGPCAQAKFGLVGLFFLNAFVSKWIGEEAGFDYSFWGGLGGGLVSYFMAISIMGNFKVAFIAGIIGMGILGFLGGAIFEGEDDE